MDVTDVMDGATNRIDKRRATSDRVIGIGHLRDIAEFHAIVQNFALVIKKHG